MGLCAPTAPWTYVVRPLLSLVIIIFLLLLRTGPAVGLSSALSLRTNDHILGSHVLRSLIVSKANTDFALRGEQLNHIQPHSSRLLRRAWSEASSSTLRNPNTVTRPVDAGVEFGQCSLVGGIDELCRPKASVESVLASAFQSALASRLARLSRHKDEPIRSVPWTFDSLDVSGYLCNSHFISCCGISCQ